MEYGNIHDLTNQKCRDAGEYDPHALSEYAVKRIRHIGYAIGHSRAIPKIGSRNTHGQVEHQERIPNQGYSNIRYPTYGFRAIVFIHDIGHDEFERPKQYTAGETDPQARLPKQGKVQGLLTEQLFQ